jgi:hypothetical protein
MDAFRLLDRSEAVLSFDVIEHRIWRTGSYLRLRVLLHDGSELHTREFADETDRKYSFHWQTAAGELLARWDNAPHHPELPTHPDHKHVPSGVEPTSEVALDDVLACIQLTLSRR